MKKQAIISILVMLIMVSATHIVVQVENSKMKQVVKVGFVYVGDACNKYTSNFIKAQNAIEEKYTDKVIIVPKYNVAEGSEEKYILELIEENCDIIFGTSYGYGKTMKEFAAKYPSIQFCQATGSDCNEEPVLSNYHNFMGEIYQGRYISGVVAGLKLKELIDKGQITSDEALVGYVAAFPYAEVISGYTAFLLGVRSVVPSATMKVIYTNSWGDYSIEKSTAQRLINEGCVIISQHSDTTGPATACEEAAGNKPVYHVGYNQSMSDVAPTTSLISCRINWQYYMVQAVEAVFENKRIESVVDGHVHGNDVSGGMAQNWVQMLRLNSTIAAAGTQEEINRLTEEFKKGNINVFIGDYLGVDPFDETDTYDLNREYKENATSSAPTFHYVLKDIIEVEE